ncbi:MAG: N-acetyl sugar amidotransferase [Fuerstiella sp.]|nr:N-acetyl sugar amidotransferase [Fuerstiella sp.]MCP4858874.1 N-acetyl sugar amidotransferase [Fuerstiella sp.]
MAISEATDSPSTNAVTCELTTSSPTAQKFQQCSVGLLDTNDDPEIRFDDQGRSHYYHEYHETARKCVVPAKQRPQRLKALVERIKRAGKGKPYDCIVGVSGGVDSTYVALIAKQLGLRPLAVHLDNGWNSELAVQNITNIVNRLEIDLHTKVLDWDSFRRLQDAYLRAGVIDVEVPTDHAIAGSVYRIAMKHNVKFILSGNNRRTECTIPPHWNFHKLDHVNLLAINRRFGTGKLKAYPLVHFLLKQKMRRWFALESIPLLDIVEYDKSEAKRRIAEELSWRDYGGKHYESIFTRFYQGYILPEKFGVDKRKAHLSDLIFAGQMTKNEAIEELSQPIYDAGQFRTDYEFFLKKMGYSESDFDRIMKTPQRRHSDFPVETAVLANWRGKTNQSSRQGNGTV